MTPLLRLAVAALALGCLPATAQTFAVSEEDPPRSCPPGAIVSNLVCSGDFCDVLTITCSQTDMAPAGSHWTPWFEADGRTGAACTRGDVWSSEPIAMIMTGIACRGGNCDDLSMQCTRFPGLGLDMGGCITVDHSDEDGRGLMPAGHGIAEMQCSGRHCDNLRVTICPVVAE